MASQPDATGRATSFDPVPFYASSAAALAPSPLGNAALGGSAPSAQRRNRAAVLGQGLLANLDVKALFPLSMWWQDGAWRRGHTGLFAAFAVAPFALLQWTSDDVSIERAAWGFAIYFGLVWALAMHALIKPEPQSPWLLVRVAAFTAVAGATIAVTLSEWLGAGDSDVLSMTFAVGVPEELSKALPVYLFVFLSRRKWAPRTYLFAGVISGLTFGVTEAVLCTALYDDIASIVGSATSTSATTVSVWRLLSGGMIHACLAAIPAYFIGLAYWHRRAVWPLFALGLGVAATLHGVYNAASASWFGGVVAAAIVFVFLGYVRSGDAIAVQLVSAQTTSIQEQE